MTFLLNFNYKYALYAVVVSLFKIIIFSMPFAEVNLFSSPIDYSGYKLILKLISQISNTADWDMYILLGGVYAISMLAYFILPLLGTQNYVFKSIVIGTIFCLFLLLNIIPFFDTKEIPKIGMIFFLILLAIDFFYNFISLFKELKRRQVEKKTE